jgi:SPP1 family predicted phage head-tail adaptor
MRAGQLDTRVALQRKTTTYSSSGEPVETWSTLVERWSALRPLTGAEVNAAEQWVAREQTEFTVRWSQEIADLSPLDRVICPADDASVSPEVARSVYDIVAVHEVGRNEALRITAARRVA